MDKLKLGVHTSISGGVQKAVKSQKEKTGNCGQIFSCSPRSWSEPSFTQEEVRLFKKECKENNIKPWVIHSSYLVNICSPKEDLREKSKNSLQNDIDAAENLSIDYVNFHFGAHTGAGEQKGLENAVNVINSLDIPDSVKILIEFDSGSGTNLGHNFNQLSKAISMTETTRLGFCLDTAHLWAAGYDISTKNSTERVFQNFNQNVGIENLSLIHLNDTKYERGSNRDEHYHIGEGEIGYEGLKKVVDIAAELNIPIIAETPIDNFRNDKDNLTKIREMWRD